jgi:hypothetical protein
MRLRRVRRHEALRGTPSDLRFQGIRNPRARPSGVAPQGRAMARTGLNRARLSRLEQSARSAGTGARRIVVTVPRASYLDTGTDCHEHRDCRFTYFDPVETHFLRTDSPGQRR